MSPRSDRRVPSLQETRFQELSDQAVDVSAKDVGIDVEVVDECGERLVKRPLRQVHDNVRANLVQTEVLLGLEVQQDHLPINLPMKYLRRYFEGR